MTLHMPYTYLKPTHINEKIQDVESGSSTEQPQLPKEAKKDFFILWCWQSASDCAWEKSVLSVSRINDPFVARTADTCVAPRCSTFLCRLGVRGRHHD